MARPGLRWPSTAPEPKFARLKLQVLQIPADQTKSTHWTRFPASSQGGQVVLFQTLGYLLLQTSVPEGPFDR